MLNVRFEEASRSPDAKFLAAGAGDSPLGRTVDAFSLSARVKDGGIADGLAALELEARRAQEFGFSVSEFALARRAMASFYQRAYDERDKTDSPPLADEYLRNFLVDEPSPGIAYEYELTTSLLREITLQEVTDEARRRLSNDSRVVLATAPEKPGLAPPADRDLLAALAAADGMALSAPSFDEGVSDRRLMTAMPAPAEVKSRREIAALGVTVVKFANGVEAWLKPTDFKNDQVLFSMASRGGASSVPESDFADAEMSASYVRLSGLNGISSLDLQKMVTGTSASAAPFVTATSHGVSGGASPSGLEMALQMLYLSFTAPNDDPAALDLLKRQLDSMVANRGQSPGQVFGERVAEVNSSSHYTSKPLTVERVNALDRAKMIDFYRQRFSNAADFGFFMVGAFKVDDVVPLLARYVGSLPSRGKATSEVKDLGIRFPSNIQRARVEKGREPRSQTAISFFAEPSLDLKEQERVAAATSILQLVLRDVLRESLGQTYGVSVFLSQQATQRGAGHIRVSFAAAPENIDGMIDRVLQEVGRLQEQGPTDAMVATIKETARRQYEASLKQNGFWLNQLVSARSLGRDPGGILERPQRIAALNAADIKEAFRKYFPRDRYTVVTLVPEQRP